MGPDHVPYRSSHVGELNSLFASDTWQLGFSEGERIPGGGISLLKGAAGKAGGPGGIPEIRVRK